MARIPGKPPRDLTVRMGGNILMEVHPLEGHVMQSIPPEGGRSWMMVTCQLPGWEDTVDCSPAYKSPSLVYQYSVMMPIFIGHPNM